MRILKNHTNIRTQLAEDRMIWPQPAIQRMPMSEPSPGVTNWLVAAQVMARARVNGRSDKKVIGRLFELSFDFRLVQDNQRPDAQRQTEKTAGRQARHHRKQGGGKGKTVTPQRLHFYRANQNHD